jgi:hypothetical protein
MAKVCIGCGLTLDSNGSLIASTAGVWPYSGSPASNGQAIYCDPGTGALFGPPAYTRPTQSAAVVFTTTGSLTATQAAGAIAIKIRGCNGGAGGGGAATTTAGQSAAGGPGGGGAAAEKTIPIALLTFPLNVNIGPGGTAGAAGANNGGIGGQSSVVNNAGSGAVLWTPGVQRANQVGSGGSASATTGDASVAGFDTTTTGAVADLVMYPQQPPNPFRGTSTNVSRIPGGQSNFGPGGNAGNGTAGTVGIQGGGGGGAYVNNGTAQAAGGAGGPGIVIVEFIY